MAEMKHTLNYIQYVFRCRPEEKIERRREINIKEIELKHPVGSFFDRIG